MDYFEAITTSASDFEKKKNDKEQILAEISKFSEAIEKYTKQKYDVCIGIDVKLLKEPSNTNPFEAIKIGLHDMFPQLKPHLVAVNEFEEYVQITEFRISLAGFPISARSGSNELAILNIVSLKSYLTSLPKEFRFLYEIENFALKTKTKIIAKSESN